MTLPFDSTPFCTRTDHFSLLSTEATACACRLSSLIIRIMPQTANPHTKNKAKKTMPSWDGTLTHTSWADGGREDQYFKGLLESGEINADTKWKDIKKRPEAVGILGAFKLDTIRNKFKKFVAIAKANEERARAATGKSVASFRALRSFRSYTYRPLTSRHFLCLFH